MRKRSQQIYRCDHETEQDALWEMQLSLVVQSQLHYKTQTQIQIRTRFCSRSGLCCDLVLLPLTFDL